MKPVLTVALILVASLAITVAVMFIVIFAWVCFISWLESVPWYARRLCRKNGHRWQHAMQIQKATFEGEKRSVEGWLKHQDIPVTEGAAAFCFTCLQLMPEETREYFRGLRKQQSA